MVDKKKLNPAQIESIKSVEAALRENAETMVNWSIRDGDELAIRQLFKQFVDFYKLRVAFQRFLAGKDEIMVQKVTSDDAAFFLSEYFQLKRITVYSWLSETIKHSTITWERFYTLIYREYCITHPEETFAQITLSESARYLSAMELTPPRRTKAGAQPAKRGAPRH